MTQEICAHDGCERETTRSVSKDGKCIFHCEKDDWFTTDANGEQDWSKEAGKVKAFWDAFKQEWTDGKSDFSFSLFPEISAGVGFPNSVVLKKSTGEDVDPKLSFYGAHFIGTVIFGGYTFWKFVDFSSATFALDVYFFGATFVQKAGFGNAKFMQYVDFNHATFKEDASFSSAYFTGKADFGQASFTQEAHFNKTAFTQNVDFTETTFKENTHFIEATFTQNAEFKMATFKQDILFNQSSFTQGANFNDATFHEPVKFENVEFLGNSEFVGTEFEGMASYERCVFDGSVSFLDLSVPALTFHSATINGHFRIGANLVAKMKHLELFQCTFNKDSVVIIENLIVGNLSINHLVCLSPAIKFGKLMITEEFTINDSMMSSAELNNINLEKAYQVNIVYSSLSKTIFNNVKWGNVNRMMPNKITFSDTSWLGGLNKKIPSWGTFRDTFRQLKAANEDQKNYLQANEFYMMEMKAYREEIEEREWWRQERIDFWFGDFVSRFSNDWVRPIILLILMTIPFYFASQVYSQYTCLKSFSAIYDNYLPYFKMIPCNPWMYLKALVVELNGFLSFMNPLETKYEDHNTPALIWIPYKIVGGLIIYQIIISLRRKTRR